MITLIRSCTVVLFSATVIATSVNINVTHLDELRRPRVVGRIVKLYSGSRPEPVVCAEEGYQADPKDCAVFYRCIKGGNEKYTVFRFQCGPGTIYDPETEVCNHPKSTKRSECFSSSRETNIPMDVNNENDIDLSRSQELPSPIKINKPVYATAHSTVKRNGMIVTTVNPLKTTSKTLVLNQNPKKTNQQGDACITDGFMGDSENCRKFYRCVGNGRGSFIRYEFSCSENTVWDDQVQSCNHPFSVRRQRCGRRIDKDTDTNTAIKEDQDNNSFTEADIIQEQTQINYGSKFSHLQVQTNNKPTLQNETEINYGDRVNQTQRQDQLDSDSTHNEMNSNRQSTVSTFQKEVDKSNKTLQHQMQIDNKKQMSQIQTQTIEIDDDSSDSGYNNNNDINTEKPRKPQVTESNVENINRNKCTSSGFIGDSEDCNKFYRCVDDGKGGYTRFEFSCGEGTVWDASIEGCNHPWAVQNCNEKAPVNSATTTEVTVAATTSQAESTTQSIVTSTDDDNEDTGYATQNEISPTTTGFSRPTDMPQVTTDVSTSNDTICTHNGFTGDAKDCKKFYRCVDNGSGAFIKYEFSCGDGTVWDSEIEACNHVWAVEKCGGGENSDFANEETTTQKQSSTNIPLTTSSTTGTTPSENYENEQPSQTTQAPTTTIKTQQANECKTSGFMGDQHDCKKFYRCVDDGRGTYTRYEFSCGDGTVWDQMIEGCNHVWAVKTCSSNVETQTQPQYELTTRDSTDSSLISETDSGEGYNSPTTPNTETTSITQSQTMPNGDNTCNAEGFFGDEEDCKKFYRCVNDGNGDYTKYEFTCGEGTVWDSTIQGCNHPSDQNKCGSNSETVTSTSSKPETSKTTTTMDMSQTNQQSTTQQPQTNNGICETEGFHPDPTDCKKFYRCVDGGNGSYMKYEFTCGEGTVWDQKIQGCNHEYERKDCKGSVSSTGSQLHQDTTTEQSQETTKQESVTQHESTTQNVVIAEQSTDANIDQGSCTSDGFFANPSNCKKFYRCVSDSKGDYTRYDFTCGEGTVWVQEIQACDHDNDINSCSGQDNVTTTSTQTTQQFNTDGSEQQTSASPPASTQPQTQADEYPTESSSSSSSSTPTNSEQCTSEGFYPNEYDCTKFYRCVDNGNGGYTKYDFSCGEGTAWDSNIQACNYKSEVESCKDSSQEKPGTQPQQDEAAEPTQTTIISTTSGSTTTESTSGPCSNDTGSEKPSSKDECKKEGYYGDSQDCTKFYRCVDDGKGGFTKYDFQCGEGTIWDQDITACNHPADVNNPSCNNQGENSDSSTISTTSSSQEDFSASSQSSTQSFSSTTESNNQAGANCSQEESSKKPEKSQVNCTKAGFYPDPNDCKKFYRCVDWDGNGQRFSVFHFDCGEGTIWDPALETCNYEDSVYPPRDCSGQETQSETAATTEVITTSEESTSTSEQEQSSTTQQQTTIEETTTQQLTSNSTQQSTVVQQTTTEQSITSELTTSEQVTTEQSTEQSTTKQTTTEQSTTNQQTEKPTTEHLTTIVDQTTTEQSTTNDQTTTEQATATEQSTTSDYSTTTSKDTTPHQSTTEQTTTQQITTSEDSTTTELTTNEETTTQHTTTSTSDSSTSQESTTHQHDSSTTESSTEDQTTTEQSSSKPDKCPETDDDQYTYVCPTGFRRHPKYCNLFYQCTEDDDTHEVKVATFACPNNTIYDENKTQCVEEDKADRKCDGQIAQKRRVKRLDIYTKEPMVVSKEKHNCLAVGHFPFERQDECSPAFLKCERSKSGMVRGFVYQCPHGYVYWAVSRRCEFKSSVRNCKQADNSWSGRWEIPVERRNVAP